MGEKLKIITDHRPLVWLFNAGVFNLFLRRAKFEIRFGNAGQHLYVRILSIINCYE